MYTLHIVKGAKADEDNTELDSDVAVKKKNPKSAKLSVSNLASDGQSDDEDYDEEDDDEHDSDESDYEQLYDKKVCFLLMLNQLVSIFS